MKNITQAIEKTRASLNNSLTMFWDKQCLPFGENWELGFLNCLRNSKVIVLLISPRAVKNCLTADIRDDNFLLEMDLATDLHADGKAVVIPVFMVQHNDPDFPGGHAAFLRHLLSPGTFPEKRAKHRWSSLKTIAATMRAVTQLPNALNIFQNADFSVATDNDFFIKVDQIASKCKPSTFPLFCCHYTIIFWSVLKLLVVVRV